MASSLTRQQRVALKTWTPQNLKGFWAAYLKKNPGAKLPSTGMAPNVGGFAPFAMPDRPPPGTYDPSIDAQEAASGRGYGDLQQDTGIANTRAEDDFTLGKGRLQEGLDRLLGDIGTARTRENEDYGRAIGDLTHHYDVLRGTQEQQANAMGMTRGGALQQALAKRTANMAHDRAPIDTGHNRTLQDLIQQETRGKTDFEQGVGDLSLGLSRGNEDRANQLGRAGRENTQFGVDAGAQRWYQATQAGYDPGQKPAGEHGTGRKAYRYVRTPRGTRRLLSTGYLIGR